jgi:signal transduction histidine kinase/ActR/RegA family two-component response regulator
MSAESDTDRPSRATALAVTAALIVLWGAIRLMLTTTSVFPLTFAIPLLVHVWTRDRLLLWTMALVFSAFHAVKMFLILPPDLFSPAETWTNYGATVANVTVAAVAVHLIIGLRTRLEHSLAELRERGVELAQQNEELAMQAEELSNQTEELTQQGEELANQNEELQSQSEEIAGLMETLERREKLLQTLLDTARSSGSEDTALRHIAAAAGDLFVPHAARVLVYENVEGRLLVRADHPRPASAREPGSREDHLRATDDFAALALAQDRTASIDDLRLRRDLRVPEAAPATAARAGLVAPIYSAGTRFGALAVYGTSEHGWTDEEYRLAEWLADQCGRLLQALRIQSTLREADRRKSEFLATLSHELRNPLAAIKFALELVEAGKSRDGQAIDVMRRQLKQLVRLVDDLLDATRLSSSKVQIRKANVDLVRIVRQAVDAVKPDVERARLALAVQLPPYPVWLEADADRIDQVVMNLLHNAVRYNEGGGRIAVTVGIAADEALLSVGDTGIGLEPADIDRIFEMFFQVGGPGSGGLGIGLALVRGIVELHGGRVEARSDGSGRGSEFRVWLPLAARKRVAASHQLPDSPERGDGSYRVLVVDDNVDSAKMIGAVLEIHGHTVRIAYDAHGALDAANDFEPDAALLDIGLPGIDGYQLARTLRAAARTRELRLIALTGWGQDGDRVRAREAGFDAHLTKPAEPATILDALRKRPESAASEG